MAENLDSKLVAPSPDGLSSLEEFTEIPEVRFKCIKNHDDFDDIHDIFIGPIFSGFILSI